MLTLLTLTKMLWFWRRKKLFPQSKHLRHSFHTPTCLSYQMYSQSSNRLKHQFLVSMPWNKVHLPLLLTTSQQFHCIEIDVHPIKPWPLSSHFILIVKSVGYKRVHGGEYFILIVLSCLRSRLKYSIDIFFDFEYDPE